jgi:hypothetical protein
VTEEKVARVNLDPEIIATVDMTIGDQAIHTVLLGEAEGFAPTAESVVGLQESRDAEGNMTRRFLKLPRRVMESKQTIVEFYEDHDSLVKGITVGSVVGLVAVGSLVIRRFQK